MQYTDFTNFIDDQVDMTAPELTLPQISANLDTLTDYIMGLELDYHIIDKIFENYHIIDPDNNEVMQQLSSSETQTYDYIWDQHPGLRWYIRQADTFIPVDADVYLDVIADVEFAIEHRNL